MSFIQLNQLNRSPEESLLIFVPLFLKNMNVIVLIILLLGIGVSRIINNHSLLSGIGVSKIINIIFVIINLLSGIGVSKIINKIILSSGIGASKMWWIYIFWCPVVSHLDSMVGSSGAGFRKFRSKRLFERYFPAQFRAG